MTIDEAIKHCEDVVELNEMYCDTTDSDRIKCAADHRQLAEWLTELKDLREENKVLIQECDRLIKEKGELLKKSEQIAEYKRLLKAAVEDFRKMQNFISDCTGRCENCPIADDEGTCQNWQYEKEALKLLND